MMPLFWTAAAFVTGILLGKTLPVPFWVWAGLAVLAFGVLLISTKKAWYQRLLVKVRPLIAVSPFLLLFFIGLGGLRFDLGIPHWRQNNLAWYNDRGTFGLVAVVDRSPDVREDAVYLHFSARELYDPSSMTFIRVTGSALARLPKTAVWQLGDVLRMNAVPKTPSDNADFSYRDYLEHQGIYTILYYPTSLQRVGTGQAGVLAQLFEPVRILAAKTIYQIYPQPESGLLEGILLGNDNNLPAATGQAYQDTGTAHIIAISGFNMAILAAIFSALFAKLTNRYWSLPLTAGVLTVYALFVGGSPSVVRAAIMAVVTFGGHLIGRKNNGLNALGLSAGVMCLLNPQLPWDVSFQLSFMATLGLVLFAGPLQEGLKIFLSKHFSEAAAARLSGPISEYFLFTLAAQITTLPVILLQFKRFSLTALLANPLALPVQPAVMVGGMSATLLGMAWLPAGQCAALLTWPLLAYSNWIVTVLDRIRGGTMTITNEIAIRLSILVVLLLLLFILRKNIFKWIKQFRRVYLLLPLALLAFALGSSALRGPDGTLHLRLVRSGDETALFLKSPTGTTLLVDPSSESNSLAAEISPLLSPWQFHLDEILATEAQSAQNINGLNERLPVRQVILAPSAYLSAQGETPATLSENIPLKKLGAEESIQIEPDLALVPLASDLHHSALLIRHGQVKILIPNGVDPTLLASFKATELASLSILILNETDTENLPADMWQNYGAQTILWNSAAISPDPAWKGLDEFTSIEVISNGIGVALKTLR